MRAVALERRAVTRRVRARTPQASAVASETRAVTLDPRSAAPFGFVVAAL